MGFLLRLILPLLLSCNAAAQDWPTRPVRIVVPFAVGGSLDFVIRAISDPLAKELGQPVVVDNRTGASGNIGADYVAKQPADGYLLLAGWDGLAANPHLYKLTYDPAKAFVPVIKLTTQPIVIAVHPSLKVDDFAGLIAAAKANPGGIPFGTSGAGTGQHMLGEWIAQAAGVQLTHVPYKGGGAAIADLIGGQIQLASLGSGPVMAHHNRGAVKIIAQSTAARSQSLRNVPTLQEAGLAGVVLDQWLGIFAVAGTPPAVVDKLNAALRRILSDPDIKAKLAQQGLDVDAGSPEAFAQQYKSDYESYQRLTKQLNIKVE
ncbi:MAG: Bug family tripartite tricarboxylate transporter substrate binding protein [Lautropia sp.]